MKRTKMLLTTSLLAAGLLGLAGTAQAQETPPPSPPPAASSSGGGAGIGVGVAQSLSGVTAGQFVYDQAMWHIEGLLEFASTSNMGGADRSTEVGFGAGGWYHLHRGSASDFSVGGALVVRTQSGPNGNSTT